MFSCGDSAINTISIKHKNYEEASVSARFNVMTRRLAEAQKFTNRTFELCKKKYMIRNLAGMEAVALLT